MIYVYNIQMVKSNIDIIMEYINDRETRVVECLKKGDAYICNFETDIDLTKDEQYWNETSLELTGLTGLYIRCYPMNENILYINLQLL